MPCSARPPLSLWTMASDVCVWGFAPFVCVCTACVAAVRGLRRRTGPLFWPLLLLGKLAQCLICSQLLVLLYLCAGLVYRVLLVGVVTADAWATDQLAGRGVTEVVQTAIYGPSPRGLTL